MVTSPPPEEKKKAHILLADDDPSMRRLFGGRLSASGFEVIYAVDGNEAREMARRFRPDLVLMDMHMPVMDGIEAANRMKSEAQTSAIPIILLTNVDLSVESEKAVKELGIGAYVQKGADFQDILASIQKTLGST